MTDEEHAAQQPPPTFRDKRRVDPDTGELRQPEETPAAQPGEQPVVDGHMSPEGDTEVETGEATEGGQTETEPAAEPQGESEAERQLAERTADLQRLQAEYVNYRRRVERDREAIREGAVAKTLESLLPVLDDIGRAREAGELEGGFKAVAESFERTVTGLGLAPFGEVGDEFDPRRHEALMHAYSDDVTGPTCTAILQVGYEYKEKVVRAARVAVSEPDAAPAGGADSGSAS